MNKGIFLLGCVGLMEMGAFAYTNLASAYAALGFDPWVPGNAAVVLFADPHMSLDPNSGRTPGVIITNLDPRVVDRVNEMVPAPAKIIVAGDVSSSYSTCPGQTPNWASARVRGSNEMRFWSSSILAFTNVAQTNIFWVPGNHDTDPRESNADLFCQLFPNMPPYQRLEIGGVRFLLMNGGNMNYIDEPQKAWFKAEMAVTSPTQTVAVVIHWPVFSYQRGSAELFRDCFANWPSRWWLFAGHAHSYGQEVWDIGLSNVTRHCTGSVNTNTFNWQTTSPGFTVLCLSNGIAGRIYYHLNSGVFDITPEPNWQNPQHWVPAFGEIPGLLWRREKVPGVIFPEVLVTNVAYDALYYYAYVHEMQWALPLKQHGNQATHFLVNSYVLPEWASFGFSDDRTNWVLTSSSSVVNGVTYYEIPHEFVSKEILYARILAILDWYPYPDIGVAGWGLATTNPPPWSCFPQLAPIPDQFISGGRPFAFSNSVTDPYAPPDVLNFSLLSAPAGVAVDSTGLLTWHPPILDHATNVSFAVKVCDCGAAPMCSTQYFTVHVSIPQAPIVSSWSLNAERRTVTVSGDPGKYTLWGSTNLLEWTRCCSTTATCVPLELTDPEVATLPCRFYRVTLEP